MIFYRNANKFDYPQIKNMYKNLLDYEINEEMYEYFYYEQDLGNYNSLVAIVNGKVIGHNAIVRNKYIYKNIEIIVGLSSGGMVVPEYSGLFYQILKRNIKSFKGDIIIAFPNRNAQGFFTKIFNFNVIEQNYFSIDRSKIKFLKRLSNIKLDSNLLRSKNHINWRIDKHPINKYESISLNKTEVIYKKYLSNNIDIMYVNYFNDEFVKILIKLLENYKKINIIHWDKNYMGKIGFEEQKNNIFVYKNISNKENVPAFECQMIDSDVF